jgi:hypothetical protein
MDQHGVDSAFGEPLQPHEHQGWSRETHRIHAPSPIGGCLRRVEEGSEGRTLTKISEWNKTIDWGIPCPPNSTG